MTVSHHQTLLSALPNLYVHMKPMSYLVQGTYPSHCIPCRENVNSARKVTFMLGKFSTMALPCIHSCIQCALRFGLVALYWPMKFVKLIPLKFYSFPYNHHEAPLTYSLKFEFSRCSRCNLRLSPSCGEEEITAVFHCQQEVIYGTLYLVI